MNKVISSQLLTAEKLHAPGKSIGEGIFFNVAFVFDTVAFWVIWVHTFVPLVTGLHHMQIKTTTYTFLLC